MLPIYHALTKPELLKKCLHGKTQNANESFNGMIWNRIPKATHVGINNLSLGVYDAIAYFNYGMKATLDVFKMLNIEPDIYTMQICDNLNKERKRNALYKISDKYKKRRKPIRHLSKQKQDKNMKLVVFRTINLFTNIIYFHVSTFFDFFSNFLNGSGYIFCIFYLNLTKLGQLVNITYMYDLKF